MSTARAEALRGHAAMLAFSAFVAGSFSLGALAANAIEPAAINAVRFAIAAAILAAVAWAGPGFRRQHFAAPWRYLVLGAVFAIYFVLMFEGLKTAAARRHCRGVHAEPRDVGALRLADCCGR